MKTIRAVGARSVHRPAHRLTRKSDIVFVIGLLLVHRIFGVGCGPKDGEPGGDCIDNGCNLYCGGGGTCDDGSNTCVAAPYYPPSGCSELTSKSVCGAREIPYSCLGSSRPRNDCTEDGGVFCCPTVCNVIAPACTGPTTSYRCNDGVGPEDAGACALVDSYDRSSCCATGDTCFTPLADDGYCAAGMLQTFCTGNAPVPDQACKTIPGSPGLRSYCCPNPDAGVSDGGVDAADAQ